MGTLSRTEKPNQAARTRIAMAIYMSALCLTGCFVPFGSKVTSGQSYSRETLEFLKQPGATRSEVISTLGPPLIDYESMRTLVYVWHEKPRYLSFWPRRLGQSGSQDLVEYAAPEQWALLIAYDTRGNIVAYDERYIDTRSLEQECRAWYRARAK